MDRQDPGAARPIRCKQLRGCAQHLLEERGVDPAAVATRFDKRGYVYLGTTTAAALAIWLRT
ncbi:hypothetical protein AB0E04_39300 [Streptomyces sp. NPDC048251]|uniref:hypothetical protein n=1 Tax=Streptomyces sp. NPDC048251 TaxID=3154501 RepID=UPI00342F8D5F